jgi:hypothetical protein
MFRSHGCIAGLSRRTCASAWMYHMSRMLTVHVQQLEVERQLLGSKRFDPAYSKMSPG